MDTKVQSSSTCCLRTDRNAQKLIGTVLKLYSETRLKSVNVQFLQNVMKLGIFDARKYKNVCKIFRSQTEIRGEHDWYLCLCEP